LRITYISLENFIGIQIGQQCSKISIDMSKSISPITCIRGRNGSGKSVLLSELHCFPYNNLDNRNTISTIIKGKTGLKEIHYLFNGNKYIIKHIYRPNNDSHSVKCYIQKNDIELNENGNYTSFLNIIFQEFQIKESDFRLIRLGTNIESFISLSTLNRKKYILTLMDNIDSYLQIHKSISTEIRKIKTLIDNANLEIIKLNLNINTNSDYDELKSKINIMEIDLKMIMENIGIKRNEINNLNTNDNDINTLSNELIQLKSQFQFYENTNINIKKNSIKQLRENLDILKSNLNKINTQFYELKSSITSNLKNIEFCKLDINNLNNDSIRNIRSNILEIELKLSTYNIPQIMKVKGSLDDIQTIISYLNEINNICKIIYNNPDYMVKKAIDLYLDKNINIGEWYDNAISNTISSDNKSILIKYINSLESDKKYSYFDDIQCQSCIYQHIINTIINNNKEFRFDPDSISIIKSIYYQFEIISTKLNSIDLNQLPISLRKFITIDEIIKKIQSYADPVIDLLPFIQLKKLIIDRINIEELQYKLIQYKKDIFNLADNENYQKTLEDRLNKFNDDNIQLNRQLNLIQLEQNRIQSSIKEAEILIANKIQYDDIHIKINQIKQRIIQIEKLIDQENNKHKIINQYQYQINELLNLYNKNKKDYDQLNERFILYTKYNSIIQNNSRILNQYNKICDAVSPKKGIPLIYIDLYLNSIKSVCNNLLSLAYGNELQLMDFVITDISFEIPYMKNGKIVKDIKYASQGENALITMTLSFALASSIMDNYNILLIDEMDSTLDIINKSIFIDILYKQLNYINAEQCFIITHSSSIDNIAVNCIDMSPGITKLTDSLLYNLERD